MPDAAARNERRRRSCQAALGVARQLGLHVRQAVILRDWNNTIVRLAPSPIVAKVGTSHFRDARLESLDRELAIATHLAASRAPVIPPAGSVSPGPHRWGGLTVTLWEHVHEIRDAALAPADIAFALKQVHTALTDYASALPSFSVALDDARTLLEPARSPTLKAADRRFLLNVLSEFQTTAATPSTSGPTLHGSPHQANWLASTDGLVLLDFETACHGPVEWDLAALDDDVAKFFHDASQALIASLRRLRSACVAAKCWVAPERAPEVGEAAQIHLRLLRGQPLE